MKRWHLYGKRIGALLLFILCMIGVNEILRYILIDDVDSLTRITMHELYEQENIDVLFLGSSHSYRSINTAILDEEWEGVNTFNAGTSSQNLVGSYYLLREAAKENRISTVYLEVFYELQKYNPDYQSPTAAYIISDYMKPSVNRMTYLWDSGGKDYLAHGLILARRNWQDLFTPSKIVKLVERKSRPEYRNYAYVKLEDDKYEGKGFVRNYKEVGPWGFSANELFAPISEDAIEEANQKYLNKIIDFCQKEEIELVFYSAPMSDFRLRGIGNYDSYIAQMNAFLKDRNVPYYDFNLYQSRFLDLDNSCFMDDHHLNGKGADLFSRAFADFFAGDMNTDVFFCDSYEQKIRQKKDTVFGVICLMTKNDLEEIEAKIVTVDNIEEPLYFAVDKRRDDEDEYERYRGFSEDATFILPPGETGYIHVLVATDRNGQHITNNVTFYYG